MQQQVRKKSKQKLKKDKQISYCTKINLDTKNSLCKKL